MFIWLRMCRKSYTAEFKLDIIPDRLKKYLQLFDLSVNKRFKKNLRNCWEVWMNDPKTAQYINNGRMKRASRTIVAEWVKSNFEVISTDTIIYGFDKALVEQQHVDDLNSSFTSLNKSKKISIQL